jgi:hypothetical protein
MKWLGAILLALLPATAHATQTSIICKTLDSNEYIDIVSKGEKTNDVLVQINGGPFYDGTTMLMNDTLIVTVSFVGGGLIVTYDVKGKSSLMIAINEEKQFHNLSCRFRK